MRAAALATLALLLEPVAHGEVISGKSEANAQGFQFLGKFCYDHVAGSKGQPVQQMKLEVSMSLDDTMIHNDNRPGVGLNAKWYVLVYDDEHLWCERHDNATHKNICPLGCHDDGAVCSGTPTFIRGFEPVMDAVKDNNRRMCRADGKKDKAGVCSGGGDPKEALSCKDRISGWATSERMEVVWSGADMWTPDPVYIKNSQVSTSLLPQHKEGLLVPRASRFLVLTPPDPRGCSATARSTSSSRARTACRSGRARPGASTSPTAMAGGGPSSGQTSRA